MEVIISEREFIEFEESRETITSLRSELAEKEKEREELKKALSELHRFIPSLEYLADKGINEPKNCLDAMASVSKVIDQLKNTKP